MADMCVSDCGHIITDTSEVGGKCCRARSRAGTSLTFTRNNWYCERRVARANLTNVHYENKMICRVHAFTELQNRSGDHVHRIMCPLASLGPSY